MTFNTLKCVIAKQICLMFRKYNFLLKVCIALYRKQRCFSFEHNISRVSNVFLRKIKNNSSVKNSKY